MTHSWASLAVLLVFGIVFFVALYVPAARELERRTGKKRYPAFKFTWMPVDGAMFILPAVVYSDGNWVFHFWRWALVVKYRARWVRKAWREMDADRAAFDKRLCPLCRKHDDLHANLMGDWSPHRNPIWCKGCDITFDLYEGEAA